MRIIAEGFCLELTVFSTHSGNNGLPHTAPTSWYIYKTNSGEGCVCWLPPPDLQQSHCGKYHHIVSIRISISPPGWKSNAGLLVGTTSPVHEACGSTELMLCITVNLRNHREQQGLTGVTGAGGAGVGTGARCTGVRQGGARAAVVTRLALLAVGSLGVALTVQTHSWGTEHSRDRGFLLDLHASIWCLLISDRSMQITPLTHCWRICGVLLPEAFSWEF